MNDVSTEKRKLIEQMLEMQRQFIEYEQQYGVEPEQYWAGKEGHPLFQYKEKYAELASKVVDLAHAGKGSRR